MYLQCNNVAWGGGGKGEHTSAASMKDTEPFAGASRAANQ